MQIGNTGATVERTGILSMASQAGVVPAAQAKPGMDGRPTQRCLTLTAVSILVYRTCTLQGHKLALTVTWSYPG